MKRRFFLTGVSALVAIPLSASVIRAATMEDMLKPGPLPEQVFGSPEAPVTVIEYASLTCPHCRTFHVNTWPAVKQIYVDTGKVRLIHYARISLRPARASWIHARPLRRRG